MSATIDPELVGVDSLLEAWARDAREGGQGGGMHPLERLRLLQLGAVFVAGGERAMSNDEIMIIVDRAYLLCPERTRAILTVWYKSGNAPAEVKARRLGISRNTLYAQRRAALWFIRGILIARGLRV